MIIKNGIKYSCQGCIRGHKTSRCNHYNAELIPIKRRGRPMDPYVQFPVHFSGVVEAPKPNVNKIPQFGFRSQNRRITVSMKNETKSFIQNNIQRKLNSQSLPGVGYLVHLSDRKAENQDIIRLPSIRSMIDGSAKQQMEFTGGSLLEILREKEKLVQ